MGIILIPFLVLHLSSSMLHHLFIFPYIYIDRMTSSAFILFLLHITRPRISLTRDTLTGVSYIPLLESMYTEIALRKVYTSWGQRQCNHHMHRFGFV